MGGSSPRLVEVDKGRAKQPGVVGRAWKAVENAGRGFNLLGVAIALVLGLLNCASSWRLTALLLAKGLAITNAVALYGLFVQRKGYAQLRPPDQSRAVDEWLFVAGFAACVCLFFGVMETGAAAFLTWSFRRLVRSFRPFTGLQMFHQLPEATAVFALGSAVAIVSDLPLVVLQQFFLLRLMLGGGLGKLRGSNWKNGEAMSFHYWTTPLPNILSPFFHALPKWFHVLETKATLWVEGWPTAALSLLPFQLGRTAAALLYFGLFAMINTTGSYGHLGLLSVVQVCSLLSDRVLWTGLESFTLWTQWMPDTFQHPLATVVALILVSPYLGASLVPFYECYPIAIPEWLRGPWEGAQRAHAALHETFELGKYVKFASVTTTRLEVILQVKGEGSNAFVDWPCLYKPTLLDQRPPLSVPRMPGVDWQLWFVGLRPHDLPPWVERLMLCLVNEDPDVLPLMGPCPVDRPAAIRAAVFDYRFAGDSAVDDTYERGSVWCRKFIKFLGPIQHRL
jgi:hypothetical protein